MKSETAKLGYCHSLGMKIPMSGFEVESMIELPLKDGEADYDSAKYKRAWLATHDAAKAWAKEHLPNDYWGSISITPYELTPFREFPRIMHLDYTGDSEHIERD